MMQEKKQAFILLTNKATAQVAAHYHALTLAGEGDTWLMYHGTSDVTPEAIKETRHCIFTNDILQHNRYTAIADTLIPGSNHFPLLDFYRQYNTYSHYWYIEDDVAFNGDWKDLFSFFNTDDADFISSHLRCFPDEPGWKWWHTLQHDRFFLPSQMRVRSFNPIFRISAEALQCIDYLLTTGWRGHHEVLLPTLLLLESFTIRDFGGTGPFVTRGNEDKFYIDECAGSTGFLSKGSMRYRPAIAACELVHSKIYHPVKM